MPAVSIIIPAYESHDTIAGCLDAMRDQTWRDMEVVIVDSSVSLRSQKIVANYPEVRYIHSERRLLPHAARNLGVQSSVGDIIVFTDPDIYPAPNWLERLVLCHQQTGYAVSGSVTCFGKHWFEWGVHFCKYHGSLPYKPAGPVGSAASANLLLTREMYEAAGPFKDDLFSGDYLLTSALGARGYTIWFEASASVSHHHRVTWRKYVAERYTRGKDFGRMNAREVRWSKLRLMLWLMISVFPVRLVRLLTRTARTAQRGSVLHLYLSTLPVVALGFAAWLAGESMAYAKTLWPYRRRQKYRSQMS